MWEFTAHLFPTGTRWSWARLDDSGEPIRQSGVTFPSYASAVSNAVRLGFHQTRDRATLVALNASHQATRQPFDRLIEWPEGLAIV
jgi:hypothetical protein